MADINNCENRRGCNRGCKSYLIELSLILAIGFSAFALVTLVILLP